MVATTIPFSTQHQGWCLCPVRRGSTQRWRQSPRSRIPSCRPIPTIWSGQARFTARLVVRHSISATFQTSAACPGRRRARARPCSALRRCLRPSVRRRGSVLRHTNTTRRRHSCAPRSPDTTRSRRLRPATGRRRPAKNGEETGAHREGDELAAARGHPARATGLRDLRELARRLRQAREPRRSRGFSPPRRLCRPTTSIAPTHLSKNSASRSSTSSPSNTTSTKSPTGATSSTACPSR